MLDSRLRDLLLWLREQREAFLANPAAMVTPRRISGATLGAGLFAAMLHGLRKKVGEVPLSTLMRQVELGLVRTASIAAGACAYRLKDDRLLRAHLLPSETRQLIKLMHRNGVEFQAVRPSGWSTGIVLLLPFAYLGLSAWLLWHFTADLRGGDLELPDASPNATDRITFDDIGGLPGPKECFLFPFSYPSEASPSMTSAACRSQRSPFFSILNPTT